MTPSSVELRDRDLLQPSIVLRFEFLGRSVEMVFGVTIEVGSSSLWVAHLPAFGTWPGLASQGPTREAAGRALAEAVALLLEEPATRRTSNTPEPAPTAGSGSEVWPLVFGNLDSFGAGVLPEWLRDDMRERHAMGVAKYGTPLRVWNGRDAAVDAYQEALDLCVYLRQCLERVGADDPDKLTRPGLGLAWSLDRALRLAHGLGELVREKAVPVEPAL